MVEKIVDIIFQDECINQRSKVLMMLKELRKEVKDSRKVDRVENEIIKLYDMTRRTFFQNGIDLEKILEKEK